VKKRLAHPTRDGPPGWQTLWRGWSRLNDMVEGVEAMRRTKCA
jgi:hypothetical protein